MDRRTFLCGLTLGAVATPGGAKAQQTGKIAQIGILATANPRSAPFYQAFEQRLRELGYLEGQNIAFVYRDAEGKLERLPGLAAELVRLNVNVIIAATDPATRAAKTDADGRFSGPRVNVLDDEDQFIHHAAPEA